VKIILPVKITRHFSLKIFEKRGRVGAPWISKEELPENSS